MRDGGVVSFLTITVPFIGYVLKITISYLFKPPPKSIQYADLQKHILMLKYNYNIIIRRIYTNYGNTD